MTTVTDQIGSLKQTLAEYTLKLQEARGTASLIPHYEQCISRLNAGIDALTAKPCDAQAMQFREVPR